MTNFFEQAVQNEQPKAKGKTVKVIVPVDCGRKIAKLNKIREDLADLKAQEAEVLGALKPIAEQEYLKMFAQTKIKPDSFVLQSTTDSATVLLIVQDKYCKLESGTELTIQEIYGKRQMEIIGKTTEFKFNQAVLDEYGEKITKELSKAIAAMDIPDHAKKNLVKATTSKAIRKGTISNLMGFEQPETLFRLIKPVFQFKNKEEKE